MTIQHDEPPVLMRGPESNYLTTDQVRQVYHRSYGWLHLRVKEGKVSRYRKRGNNQVTYYSKKEIDEMLRREQEMLEDAPLSRPSEQGPLPRLYKLHDVARAAGVSRDWVYKRIVKRGAIPSSELCNIGTKARPHWRVTEQGYRLFIEQTRATGLNRKEST